jgi:signal transduction histidine kinase
VRNAVEAAAAAKDLGRVAAPRVEVRLGAGPGELRVTVEDNAGGPPPDIEERLFEPFVTGSPRASAWAYVARQAVEGQAARSRSSGCPPAAASTIRIPLGPSP